MGKIGIEGVLLTPLKKIPHPKGDIFHAMKKTDPGFSAFGEAYFTEINFNEIKGWNRHQRMTLNLIVPVGKVIFVIYDDREQSKTKGVFWNVEVSVDAYRRLTVPPGLWLAFKGKDDSTNLILNLADLEHDPDEIEKRNLEEFLYNWDDSEKNRSA